MGYRLCPKSQQLTEECFMRMPLAFVGSLQTLRWGNGTEHNIPATRITLKESTWTRNPIPACSSSGCDVPQFPPPLGCDATCWGYKVCAGGVQSRRLRSPPSLIESESQQVWSGCGDITVAIGTEGVTLI